MFALLTTGVLTVKADRDYVITINQLPAHAQQFVKNHFSAVKVSYIKEERDFFTRNYEIVFADGSKAEFTRSGEWIEVDCRYSEVPRGVVPTAITAYVQEHFPDAEIRKIERERGGYDVKLSNKLELFFDKSLKLRNIDD
jgi:hypothetical protein